MRLKGLCVVLVLFVIDSACTILVFADSYQKDINEFSNYMSEPNGELRLTDVLIITVLRNPELATFSYEIRAQDARVLQSGLLPNPELGVTVEEFGGSGFAKKFDSAQTTVQVSQLVQLAGKRAKRKNIALLDKNLAQWDYESKRLDVLAEASKTFVDVLAAQERVEFLGELVQLSEQLKNTVGARVEAGKVSPLEQTKADISYASTQIELGLAKRELDIARTKLASLWGSGEPEFLKVEGNLYELETPPHFEQLTSLIIKNPDVARWAAEIEQRKAVKDFEKSKSIPDITVSAGTQHFAESSDTAFVVGIAVPLPLFDRNQGSINEASARLSKAYEQSRAVDVRTRSNVVEAHKSLLSTYDQATALQNKVIPGAQEAFDAAKEGYSQGKFGYLDVLDAQRTLFGVRAQYIEILANYHKVRADIDRLIGRYPEAATKTMEVR
jgi:cobalt-zinc-cadmium efflux system outer membrane protein